ncbi:MAG: stage 0 sporulation family protein [Deltaproteobacteria bacterium]|nr:stage 0 sporulation family protein [Deltaproteobacteria bacterium]
MKRIVEVKIGRNGHISGYDPGHFVLKKGERVLVETPLCTTLGVVHSDSRSLDEDLPQKPLKKILRHATDEEIARFEKNCALEKEVYSFCYERIKARTMTMSLIGVECLFDINKVMVYFTADGRVDFRELVKDLVQRFRTRIEMRQVGVRHKAKMVGGLGNCGRRLCCTAFLNNFEPVSIKMAKEQNLSLNPSKISGMCGRLMCCLAYEYAYYENAKKDVPKVGKRVKSPEGEGKVIRQNVLKKTLTVLLDSGEEKDVPFSDVQKGSPPR